MYVYERIKNHQDTCHGEGQRNPAHRNMKDWAVLIHRDVDNKKVEIDACS